MFRFLFNWLRARRDQRIVNDYARVGLAVGMDDADIPGMGPSDRFVGLLGEWEELERAYVDLGFRPIPLHVFRAAAVYGKPLEGFRVQLKEGERVIHHAQEYRYGGDLPPAA